MKLNLNHKLEDKVTVTFQMYASDKELFDKWLDNNNLSNSGKLSMANVLRSHINDLIEGKATIEG